MSTEITEDTENTEREEGKREMDLDFLSCWSLLCALCA